MKSSYSEGDKLDYEVFDRITDFATAKSTSLVWSTNFTRVEHELHCALHNFTFAKGKNFTNNTGRFEKSSRPIDFD